MAKELKLSAEHPEMELVECSRQPGKLRLSRYACGRRYLRAQENMEDIPENDFGIALKWSLELCRTCPQGLTCSKNIHVKSVQTPMPKRQRIRFGKRKKKEISR
jgi:hypothetical protein